MERINLAHAKTHLSELVTRASQGEEIEIRASRQDRGAPSAARSGARTFRFQGAAADDGRHVASGRERRRPYQAHARRLPLLMFYLDASVVVASVARELRTTDVQQWWEKQQSDITFSSWTLTESISALSVRLRRGTLTAEEKQNAVRFVRRIPNSYQRVPITEAHFLSAMRYADQHELALRSGDALHVAIAADFEQTLVTLDKTMAAAATRLGIAVLLL